MSEDKPVRDEEQVAPDAAAAPQVEASSPAAEPGVEVAPAAAEPVPVTADPVSTGTEETGAQETRAEEIRAETRAEETVNAQTPASPTPAAAPTPTSTGHQVVYVETAPPPRPRGNRVVGVLLAVLGAVVFTALYAAVAALIYNLGGDSFFGQRFGQFVSSALFWVPILVFVLAFILEVVIVNRGGWAAHVFGSLLLAFVVYFASIGLLLLVGNVFTRQNLAFSAVALVPQVIAAAVIAREVAIWLGLAIAVRGRRVRARNTEARAQYDRELAEKRAQYDRPAVAAE